MEPTAPVIDSKTAIYVIGPNVLQNKLMVDYLQQHTDATCRSHSTFTWADMAPAESQGRSLFLLDAKNLDLSKDINLHEVRQGSKETRYFFALFNSDYQMRIEKEALARGFQGIFYNEDGLESLAKGALSILSGELWFSRKVLYESLKESQRTQPAGDKLSNVLTYREKEILVKMLTGAGNKKIADDLCISPHTVKTHIYNIYKKLGVNNRLQATLWAAKHL